MNLWFSLIIYILFVIFAKRDWLYGGTQPRMDGGDDMETGARQAFTSLKSSH